MRRFLVAAVVGVGVGTSSAGTVVGVTIMIITHKNMKLALPFGPFLALGALSYIFFGAELIHWYTHLFR